MWVIYLYIAIGVLAYLIAGCFVWGASWRYLETIETCDYELAGLELIMGALWPLTLLGAGMWCIGMMGYDWSRDVWGKPDTKPVLKKVKLGLLVVVIVSTFTSQADACQRCGLFGRLCKFQQVHVKQVVVPYVSPVYAAQPVYVVQNNYPQPLVAQGATSYSAVSQSYQQAVMPLLDVNRFALQTLELRRAAGAAETLLTTQAVSAVQRIAELQAPAVERLAAGTAAQMVLQAAGLDPAHNTQSSSLAVVITRDQYGRTQVQPLTQEQSLAITSRTTIKQAVLPPAPIIGNVDYPLLSKYCYTCHGVDLAEPKGKFYLGDDANIAKSMRERFFRITQQVSGDKMPPADKPQPSRDERAGILNEVQRLILSHAEE